MYSDPPSWKPVLWKTSLLKRLKQHCLRIFPGISLYPKIGQYLYSAFLKKNAKQFNKPVYNWKRYVIWILKAAYGRQYGSDCTSGGGKWSQVTAASGIPL